MQTIEEIDKEIKELNDKIYVLENKKRKLIQKSLQGKYFKIEFFNPQLFYFHCKEVFGNLDMEGEYISIYENILNAYQENYTMNYSRYKFIEITKEEYNEIKSKFIK